MAAAKKAKKTARGRKQDRARVAGGQDYEVTYERRPAGRRPRDGIRVGKLPTGRTRAGEIGYRGLAPERVPRNL
jgi:hypothetical protein